MKKFIVLSILALTLVLDIAYLGQNSYFIDEIFCIQKATHNIVEILSYKFSKLYCILLHFWFSLFPLNEFSARIPSVIFSNLSILAIFFLGRYIFNSRVGILAALFMSLSSLYLLHRRLAIMYSLVMLFSIIQVYLFLRIAKTNKRLTWFLYSLITLLALETHEGVLALILAESLFIILRKRNLFIKWAMFHLSIALLLLLLFKGALGRFFSLYCMSRHGFIGPIYALKQILYAFYLFALGLSVLPWKPYVTVPAFLVSNGILLYGLFKLRSDKDKLIFLALYLFLPLAGFSFNNMIFLPRQILIILPAYCLILSYGISQIKKPKLNSALVILIMLFSAYSISNYYLNRQFQYASYSEPTRQVSRYIIDSFSGKTDAVVISNWERVGSSVNFSYYLIYNSPRGKINKERIFYLYNISNIKDASASFNKYDRLKNNYKRIWYIKVKPYPILPKTETAKILDIFDEWLDKNCRLIQTRKFMPDLDAQEKRQYLKDWFFPDYRVEVFLYALQ